MTRIKPVDITYKGSFNANNPYKSRCVKINKPTTEEESKIEDPVDYLILSKEAQELRNLSIEEEGRHR